MPVTTENNEGEQFTLAPGQGTRVEVPPIVDGEAFQAVAREAIAAAQEQPATPPDQEHEER